ncbi:MAG TPA: VOC family protein [Polyangiaceae bacterium]|nr:VOC family protein [Polyangiaceae bacterium]HYQ27358.1 VOC family protein [Polyangiaceae bacterium]
MLGKQTLVAFVATTNAARARAFYEETLGLDLVADEPYALVFDANGTRLRLQKLASFQPQPFTTLGWTVQDINALVAALKQKNVTCERFPGLEQDELGVWASPSGARVAWFKDPDGNVLSITEF